VCDLALQIGQVHPVVIDQRQFADARGTQIQASSTSQAPCSDHQHPGRTDALLTFEPDFVQQNVPCIAQQVRVVHDDQSRTTQFSFFSSLRSTCVLLASTTRPLS